MHYLTYVFIPESGDVTDSVSKALNPFGDEFEVKRRKHYLPASDVAAMAKHYRIRRTSLHSLAARMFDWNRRVAGVDGRGLFEIETHNPHAKWDWYEIGGRWDNHIAGNVTTAKALERTRKIKDILPYEFLTPDGEWHSKETWVTMNGRVHARQRNTNRWLREFRAALSTFEDCRVVVVDLHS